MTTRIGLGLWESSVTPLKYAYVKKRHNYLLGARCLAISFM